MPCDTSIAMRTGIPKTSAGRDEGSTRASSIKMRNVRERSIFSFRNSWEILFRTGPRLRVAERKRKICTCLRKSHVAILRRIHRTINRQLGKQRARSLPASRPRSFPSNIELSVSVSHNSFQETARRKKKFSRVNRQLRGR